MNFNVYLDAATVERLNALARRRGTTRNALIREAVSHLLEAGVGSTWPEAIREFRGEPGTPAFELARRKVRAPKKDPLR